MPTALPRISEHIWDMKYRLKAADGSVLDHSIADTWARVAKAAAAAEPKRTRARWAKAFAAAMADFAFLPAGRILAGAGTGRAVTLFNCFVMGTIEDDLGSIFDNVKEAARTMQQGGGDRKSTRLNSSHLVISYAVFCLKKKIEGGGLAAACRTRRQDDAMGPLGQPPEGLEHVRGHHELIQPHGTPSAIEQPEHHGIAVER